MTEQPPSATSLWSEWQRLATRSVRDQAALAQQSWDLVRRIPVGDPLTSGRLNQDYVDATWRESQRYWSEALALGLDFADGLATLAQRSAARVLDQVVPQPGHSGAQPPPRRVALDLAGRVGSQVSSRVTVANRQRQSRRVSFEVADMVGAGSTFRPSLVVRPDSLVLVPGEERDVEILLHLDETVFAAGSVYYGEVHIQGGDNVILALEVRPD
jgi:hypothetical protein